MLATSMRTTLVGLSSVLLASGLASASPLNRARAEASSLAGDWSGRTGGAVGDLGFCTITFSIALSPEDSQFSLYSRHIACDSGFEVNQPDLVLTLGPLKPAGEQEDLPGVGRIGMAFPYWPLLQDETVVGVVAETQDNGMIYAQTGNIEFTFFAPDATEPDDELPNVWDEEVPGLAGQHLRFGVVKAN